MSGGADRRAVAPHSRYESGAAAFNEARLRSAMAVGAAPRLSPGEAAQIAKVSSMAILRAWRCGDLRGEVMPDGAVATFTEEDVRKWARSKFYIA